MYQKITSDHHEPTNPQLESDDDKEEGVRDSGMTVNQVRELIPGARNATEAARNIREPVDFDEHEYESEDDSAPTVAPGPSRLSLVSAKFSDPDSL